MTKSLLEQLPEIVREGRREAEKILESLEGRHKISLQTREIVIPNKDVAQATLFGRSQRPTTNDQRPTTNDQRPTTNEIVNF